MTTIHFEETEGFQKEFRSLMRKYRTLPNDLERLKNALRDSPLGDGNHFHILTIRGEITIVKTRLSCQALRHSSLRVIYAYHASTITIFFIELFFKGEKEAEDKHRIEEFLKSLSSERPVRKDEE